MVTSLMSFPVLADTTPSQDCTPTAGSGSGILDLLKGWKPIKRGPSRNHVEVVYENGEVSLISDSYQGDYSMSFVGLESGYCYEVPSMSIGDSIMFYLPIGEYEVEALSDDGMKFKGLLTIK